MNACNIRQTPATILKMNFNFNITRITAHALQRQYREFMISDKQFNINKIQALSEVCDAAGNLPAL
jgi:hypothetical protein